MSETVAEMFQRRRNELNSRFTVRLRFRNRIFGGIPAVNMAKPEESKNIMRVWLRKRLGDKLTEEELEAEVEKTFEEAFADAEEETTQTFKCDEGIYVEGRQVKALFKEAGGRLGLGKAVSGKRPSLRQDIHEGLHVDEDVIFLYRDGQKLLAPDGHEAKPIQVMGPKGPRTAIKCSGYAEPGVEITFTVRILDCINVKKEHLVDILAFGQDLGLGAQRSQGWGKFEVVGFEAI